jgi:hypothetical protein
MSIITIIIIIGSTIVIIVTILVIVGYPYLKSSIYLVCRCSARLLSQSVALTLRQLQREEYEAHVADLIRYQTPSSASQSQPLLSHIIGCSKPNQ